MEGGKGFYSYTQAKRPKPNIAIDAALNLKRGLNPTEKHLQRMLYLMVNEAARCLEETVVDSPSTIDTGMVFGIGFPPFRGGLCKWADSVGIESIASALETLAEQHGARFEPAGLIRDHKPFYS